MEDKKKVGRPTKYKEEYCDMLIEHFNITPQILKKKTEYYQNGNIKSESEYPVANELPTFQSFANKIDVNMDTLEEWKSKYKEFSEAYTRAKELQEHIWLVNGMSNLYNSQFAQFFGKNCLGYKDKQEIETTNVANLKIDSSLTTEEIRKMLKEE